MQGNGGGRGMRGEVGRQDSTILSSVLTFVRGEIRGLGRGGRALLLTAVVSGASGSRCLLQMEISL